jgi:hypothetical protein
MDRRRETGMSVLKGWLVIVAAMVCAVLAMPGYSSAQGSTGAIAGNVKDTSGGAVPGVTVEVASPALIERVRTSVTDSQGNYKITELRPGIYTVTFTLGGFSSVRREGIELSAGFTAPVNAELKVGSVSETITVTGASPVVDVQSVRTQSVLKNEVLDALPSGQRDIAQLASLTLGAMPSSSGRNDVGGDRGERSTGISLHGSRGDDSKLNYDGMNTNVFYGGGGGQQRTYKFNTVMVAEQVVDTAGNTSETETGGANVNMVPKDGGNKFSLYSTANYTSNGLASGKVPDSLIARGSAPDQNSMKQVWDYGIGVGGPIRQDKLWFYSGDRWWGSQSYVANNYFNKSNLFYTYVPDLSRPAYTNIYTSDFGGRLTWQITSKQKLSFEQHYQDACGCWESLTAATAPDASLAFFYKPHYMSQGSWTYPATNRLLLQAGAVLMRAQVQFLSLGGIDVPGRIRVSDTNYPGIGAYAWGGVGASVQTDNGEAQRQDNFNYRLSASYITGTHAVRIGFQGLRGTFDTRGHAPAPGYVLGFTAGVPTSLTQYADPFKMDGRVKSQAVYASDQWTIDRLTVTMGVRYDHFNVGTLPVDIPAGRFIGARHYDATQNIPNYNDITPRVGAAYDVFGNGKTAIRASWGRYLVGQGGGALTNLAPSNAIVSSTSRPWNDSPGVATPGTGVLGNGNYVPDCDLTNLAANGECGAIVTAGFGQPTTTLTWDDKARQGWGVREFNYQWNVAAQQELRGGFALQAGFYHTAFHNTQVAVNTALTASSFDFYCVPAPTDSRLGSISGQQVCGNTNVNFASKAVVANTVWFRPEDVPIPGFSGERKEFYNGGDLGLNWRFKGSGLLSGGLSLGRQTVDVCFANQYPQITGTISAGGSTAVGLRDSKFCTNSAQSLWNGAGSQVKVQAAYPLPYDFMLAATYKHLPGAALTGTVTYADAAVAPILGRNLSACTAPTGACTQTASIGVIPPGTLFDDRLNQIDLRGTRRIKIGHSRIQGIVELYNVLNSRSAQSATATWGQVTAPGVATPGTTFLRPSLLLGGRLLKFGAQIDF